MIYNTHSHLQDPMFDATRPRIIEEIQNANMTVLLVGYTPEMNQRALALADAHDCFVVAVGIHPNHASDWTNQLEQLRAFATHPKVVAIGECGLDYHWDTVDRATQKAAFVSQLELATRLQLPIIVHMRDATADTYAILSTSYQGPGVMHCYSGDADYAKKFIALGFHLGVGGPVTFHNAKTLHDLVTVTALDHLVVETDDPYLAPVPFRGQTNLATYVTYVVERIAALKQLDVDDVITATTTNATRLFGGNP
jgi:TatD DNase family protein